MANFLILTPVVQPAPGGGAQYTDLLARALVRSGVASRVTVLSEAYPHTPSREELEEGRIVVRRFFPLRAGRSRKNWWSYTSYLVQNAAFLLLPFWIATSRAQVVLLHSSFYYNPSTIHLAVRLSRLVFGSRVRMVCDVRDPKFPVDKLPKLTLYDAIVCCSESVRRHIGQDAALASRARLIPIPFDGASVSDDEVSTCCARHGLRSPFLFWSNGVSREKGIEAAVAAAALLRGEWPELGLVVVGRERDRPGAVARAVEEGWLRLLGPVPHHDVLCLSKAAAAVISLSRVEGMPRAALEALGVGARILLPPNVPEFARACLEHVCRSTEPEVVARQLRWIIQAPPPRYPLGAHRPESVVELYRFDDGGRGQRMRPSAPRRRAEWRTRRPCNPGKGCSRLTGGVVAVRRIAGDEGARRSQRSTALRRAHHVVRDALNTLLGRPKEHWLPGAGIGFSFLR